MDVQSKFEESDKSCETPSEFLQRLPNSRHERLDVGDWEINTVSAGSGQVIVLIHGLGASWQWWQPTIECLVRDYSIVAIDLPGAGQSSMLTDPPTKEQYAYLVRVLLERYGPAYIVGHSLGGFVALQAAIQRVPGILGLFLYAPAGFGKVENRYFRALSVPGLGSVLSRTGEFGTKMLLDSLVHDDRVTEQMLCWVDTSDDARDQFVYQLRLGVDWLGRTNNNLTVELAEPLTLPLHLVWGRHDSVFSEETGQHAASLLGLPAARIAENSGHFIHLEEPDWFVSELYSFMNAND